VSPQGKVSAEMLEIEPKAEFLARSWTAFLILSGELRSRLSFQLRAGDPARRSPHLSLSGGDWRLAQPQTAPLRTLKPPTLRP